MGKLPSARECPCSCNHIQNLHRRTTGWDFGYECRSRNTLWLGAVCPSAVTMSHIELSYGQLVIIIEVNHKTKRYSTQLRLDGRHWTETQSQWHVVLSLYNNTSSSITSTLGVVVLRLLTVPYWCTVLIKISSTNTCQKGCGIMS